MSKTKRNPFPYWLILFLLVLFLQATSFFTGLYFLAENLRNGNRWIAFISIALINLLFLCIVSFLNQKMSVGILGSSMQRLRTARFTAAFLTVMVTSLLAALVVYLVDEVIYSSAALTPFGPLAALFVGFGAILEFIFTYYLFQGQGISRL